MNGRQHVQWLDDQSILITGGAAGLGRALVRRCIEEGAFVTVLDRSDTAAVELKDAFGDRIAVLTGDVRSMADNHAAVALALDRFGKLDSLIPNAGIWDYSVALADIEDDALDVAFEEIFAINTKGPLFAVKAALSALVRARGNIVFTLSNAAFYAGGGGVLYTASKHASLGLVTQLAYELAPHVRVNGVAPGAVSTDLRGPEVLGQANLSLKDIPLADYVKDILPLARLPAPEEYTGSYILLASNKNAAPTTGSIIRSDGGIGIRGLTGPSGGKDLFQRYSKRGD
jgi:NAD(P)-dependent dehydrogenase (short-subunit alcohol dehydrogenase family)